MKKLTILLFGIFCSIILYAQENTPAENNCLDLDGINDYVTIPYTPALAIGAQPYTLEIWANGANIDQFGSIIMQRVPSGCYDIVGFYTNDGTDPVQSPGPGKKISFSFGLSGLKANSNCGNGYRNVTTVNDIIDGNFHHLAAVVDPSTQSIVMYIDGILQQVDSYQFGGFPVISQTEPYIIGQQNDFTAWYEGTVDEVRIWNIARSQADIQANMNHELVGNEPGLVAYYNFNQGVGGGTNTAVSSLNDASVNGNDGTLHNFALTGNTSNFTNCETVSTVTPSEDNCLNLDGIDDYVSIPHTPSQVVGSQPYTLELWTEAPDINQFGTIITKRDPMACYEQVSIYLNDGTDPIQVPTPGKKISFSFGRSGLKANSNCGDGYRVITTQNNIIDGNFHHIAAVVDPSNQSIVMYVDGVLQTVDLIQYGPFPILNHTVPYTIGRMTDHLAWYKGTVDEVRIWNIARSQTDIQADMNIELVGNEPGLVAYYNFNQGIGGGINTTISTLVDASPNSNDGTLHNFALTGYTSNFIICDTVSTSTNIDFEDEELLGEVNVFPNPSNGLVNIMVENPENKEIHILAFDNTGREIWQSEKIKRGKEWIGQFEIFQSGIYYIKVQIGTRFIYKRIVKI